MLVAGLRGFASHWSGLNLGAGCQYWKLLDIAGTQFPLSNAVVNNRLTMKTCLVVREILKKIKAWVSRYFLEKASRVVYLLKI